MSSAIDGGEECLGYAVVGPPLRRRGGVMDAHGGLPACLGAYAKHPLSHRESAIEWDVENFCALDNDPRQRVGV